uniref:Zinc finger protein 637 n=1 Tax=Mus musculus TaxID=10090 RepID=D3Z3T2_MOUSE
MFGFPTATLLDCHGRYAQNVAFFSECDDRSPQV